MIDTKWTRNAALLGLLAIGLSACSDDDDGDGGTDPVTALDTPAGAAAVAADDDLAIAVSWNAVTEAQNYLVTLEADGSAVGQETVGGTSVVFDGLLGRTEYTASIVAQAAS